MTQLSYDIPKWNTTHLSWNGGNIKQKEKVQNKYKILLNQKEDINIVFDIIRSNN